jgi:Terpene cyclase DEP1
MINLTTQQRHPSLGLSRLYLVFVTLSLLISWGIFAQFLWADGVSLSAFFEQALATPVARLLSSDIILSALIFFTFAHKELKRLGMPNYWLAVYMLGTFSVGVCFGLALFLYQREAWVQGSKAQ